MVDYSIIETFFSSKEGKRYESYFNEIINGTNDIVIFIARKGYWLYKLYSWYYNNDPNNKHIYSDRFVYKEDIRDLFLGQKIAIVDDTTSSGFTLYRVYRELKDRCENVEITPYSLFMPIEEQLNRNIYEESEKDLFKEFNEKIKCFYKIPLSELSEFSLAQVTLFQKCFIPYVIDLPFIIDDKCVLQEGVSKRYSTVESDVFSEIIADYDIWKFIDNSYSINEETINCGFFYLDNNLLNEIFGSSLLISLIKCRYRYNEDDTVNLIFTPFVMLKSLDYDEAWDCFVTLFNDNLNDQTNSYYKEIVRRNNKISDSYLRKKQLGMTILRSIIYFLSMYIFCYFRTHLNSIANINLVHDISFLRENSSEAFCNTIEEIKKWNISNFEDRIGRLNNFTEIKAPYKELSLYDEPEEDLRKEVYIRIFNEAINRKREDKNSGFISIEDMQNQLLDLDVNEKEKSILIANALLQMLDKSVLGNLVYSKGGVINRGFRCGENSDTQVPFFNIYIHYAIKTLYFNLCMLQPDEMNEQYLCKAPMVFRGLRKLFQKRGYFEYIISERYFNYNLNYYCDKRVDPKKIVESKTFLLDKVDTTNGIFMDIKGLVNDLLFEC